MPTERATSVEKQLNIQSMKDENADGADDSWRSYLFRRHLTKIAELRTKI